MIKLTMFYTKSRALKEYHVTKHLIVLVLHKILMYVILPPLPGLQSRATMKRSESRNGRSFDKLYACFSSVRAIWPRAYLHPGRGSMNGLTTSMSIRRS